MRKECWSNGFHGILDNQLKYRREDMNADERRYKRKKVSFNFEITENMTEREIYDMKVITIKVKPYEIFVQDQGFLGLDFVNFFVLSEIPYVSFISKVISFDFAL